MLTFSYDVIILWYLFVFIFTTFYLFTNTPAIRDFAAVNRIINNHPDKMCTPERNGAVISLYFLNTLQVEVIGDFMKSHVSIQIFIKDNAYSLSLIFLNKKLFVLKVVTIRCKTTIPASLTSFFFSTVHCLLNDIFAFYFSNSG